MTTYKLPRHGGDDGLLGLILPPYCTSYLDFGGSSGAWYACAAWDLRWDCDMRRGGGGVTFSLQRNRHRHRGKGDHVLGRHGILPMLIPKVKISGPMRNTNTIPGRQGRQTKQPEIFDDELLQVCPSHDALSNTLDFVSIWSQSEDPSSKLLSMEPRSTRADENESHLRNYQSQLSTPNPPLNPRETHHR